MNFMKKVVVLLIVAVMMIAAIPVGQKELKEQYKKAIQNWDSAAESYPEPDKDQDGTWLNVGLRYKYALMQDYLGIEILEKLSGEKVFLESGAHTEGLDFNNSNAFGHYNPKFINTIHESVISFLKNDDTKEFTQEMYAKHLQMTARNYYLAYYFVNSGEVITWEGQEWTKEDIENTYQNILNGEIETYGSGSNFLTEIYRAYADAAESDGYDWYEADTAPGFWIRRSIDGTDKGFIELLKAVMAEVDANW
jgi:hypothetical protein